MGFCVFVELVRSWHKERLKIVEAGERSLRDSRGMDGMDGRVLVSEVQKTDSMVSLCLIADNNPRHKCRHAVFQHKITKVDNSIQFMDSIGFIYL